MTGITSPTHMALILVVVLLVFGAKRMPELGRSLGGGLREFKRSVALGGDDQLEQPPIRDVSRQPPAPAVAETVGEAFGDGGPGLSA